MSDLDSSQNLPEKPEHQKFLLDMPDNTEPAVLHVQDLVRERLLSGDLLNVEMIAAVKEALHLPIKPVDMGATIVISNAIRETVELCGFASPEIIFQKLSIRKKALKPDQCPK